MIIDGALSKEIRANRLAGPFDTIPYPNLSGVGVVPKTDASWHLINHLSAPEDNSINDYIDPCTYSLQYHTIDDAIRLCYKLGKDTLMCKVDIKHAFRLCPVHPSDWHLLGFQWQGRFYVDTCLPFGLRSSPFIFNMLADAIQWILEHHFAIHDSFHYLDDFFFAGSASPPTRTHLRRGTWGYTMVARLWQGLERHNLLHRPRSIHNSQSFFTIT